MASYWQSAKREAKKRAQVSGYCWVWSNPEIDWSKPYLFYESSVDALPPWVPKNATRFGEGLKAYIEAPSPSLEERIQALERKAAKEKLLKPAPNPPVTTTKPMLRTARDPHHNGCAEWGWDGIEFWQRQVGTERWVRVKRSHLTPKRVLVLCRLMVGENKPLC